jgi:hypothetical protein
MGGGYGEALAGLEALLAAEDPLPALPSLGDPERLHLLFRLALQKAVRRGPGAEEPSPARLVAVAGGAAAAGTVPVATPAALRRTLGALATRLRDAGAWHPERPPWWHPLPGPTPLEELWVRLEDGGGAPVHLPDRRQLAAAFAPPARDADDDSGDATAPRWLALPRLYDRELLSRVHPQLEEAHEGGGLALAREGVGAAGRLSVRRSDSVRYLSGLEPELLRHVPELAVVVQWLLRRLGDRLALPGGAVHPPQKAMLARYPAPSRGYDPHLDNPGGEHDNGRTLTLVSYLNAPGSECRGGGLALWSPGSRTDGPPAAELAAHAGSAALFDARAVPHQVRPLEPGPARWALTLWLNDASQRPPSPPLPEPTVTDALRPIPSPPLPEGTVLFHQVDDQAGSSEIVPISLPAPRRRPRAGVVCTVYNAGRILDAWCAHHLGVGFDHLVLIFDHPDEPAEAADMERLRAAHPPERLTLLRGPEVAERWNELPDDEASEELRHLARAGGAAYAVAARQTLNASAVLEAARGDASGGAPLHWLLHLDADELLHLEGAGRGGATLADHLAAANAAGADLLRYLVHELLEAPAEGQPPRFKLNPHLAALHLGASGWRAVVAHLEMAQSDPRPYFRAHFNGKSAVRIAAARAAAGVHGWHLEDPDPSRRRLLAGPSILHLHAADPAAFRRKYLAMADAPAAEATRPFEPSQVETEAVTLIRDLRAAGAGEAEIERRLDHLHRRLTTFTAEEVEILEAAGLIVEPGLRLP